MPRTRPPTRRARLALFIVLTVLAGACGSDRSNDAEDVGDSNATDEGGVTGSITVFAAASLTDVFTELGTEFEAANPDASVELSFGPSSGLVAQITEGAPADVIATASETTVDDLVEAEALDGDPTTFATNALEIAVPPDNPGDVEGLEDLAEEDLIVALCAEEVPCGTFAREALEAAGVEPSVDSNEQDVRALVTKIGAGEVDAGVVYRTDVVAAGDDVEGIEIPDGDNVLATYPVAIPKQAAEPETARAFIDFVRSDDGHGLLVDAGFGRP